MDGIRTATGQWSGLGASREGIVRYLNDSYEVSLRRAYLLVSADRHEDEVESAIQLGSHNYFPGDKIAEAEGLTPRPSRGEAANLGARFLAATHDGITRPVIEVAGVQVYVYVDADESLRVSVHFDTADTEAFPDWADEVPVRVFGVDRDSVVED